MLHLWMSKSVTMRTLYSHLSDAEAVAAYLDCVKFCADVDEDVVHVGDMVFKPFNLLIVHLHFAEKKERKFKHVHH